MKKFILITAFTLSIWGVSYAQSATCAAATPITQNGACLSGQTFSDATFETSANNTSICGSGENVTREAWYTFQATSTNVDVTWTSGRAPGIEVFSGTCGSLTQIGCANNVLGTSNPQTELVNLTGLTIGTFYLIRIVNTASNNVNAANSGTLCVTSAAPAPANDNPCSAIALTVSSSCSYANYTNASATATAGVPAPGCANYSGGDVWFTVTVPASGNVIIDSQTGVITDAGMAVYSGACGSLTLVACDDDGSSNGAMSMISLTGQTPGAVLYIRMWEYGNDNNGTFGICAYDASVPSQNCSGAIPVCNDATFAGNSGGFGAQELTAANEGCLASGEHQTTWFGFSPSLTGTIQLNINPTAGAIDYDFAIWGPYNPGVGCPVTGLPLRCSYAAATGTTGLQTGAGDLTEGAGGDRFVESIVIGAAQVGKVYYLVVDNYTANTTPFTLDWTLSPNNMLDCTPPLPIELATFNAQPQNDANQVYWQTEVEVNNNYFVVEKSIDAINYSEIGRIDGHGNTNMINNYNLLDPNPAATTYYKLKQVDFNGDYKYFGPVVVNNEKADQFSVQNLYPNPADQSFFIDIYSKEALSSDIFVYNSYGQLVFTKVVEIEGALKLEIPSNTWTPGVYVVKIVNDEHHFQHIQRVIIK